MNELMNSQKDILGISDFLQNAEKYTQTNFPDLDLDNLFTNAISGSISTNFWTNSILNFARSGNTICDSADGNRSNCYHYP